jgi:hypothetical protein
MNNTAVDWLIEQLNKSGFAQVVTEEEIKKAKAMMEDQIKMAFVDGKWDGKFINLNSEQYYNETYGNK